MKTTTRPSQRAASAAWDALERAALIDSAACAGDDRFTLDDPPAVLATVCARCPLFAPCRAYAVTARPAAGYWAGRTYGPVTRAQEAAS